MFHQLVAPAIESLRDDITVIDVDSSFSAESVFNYVLHALIKFANWSTGDVMYADEALRPTATVHLLYMWGQPGAGAGHALRFICNRANYVNVRAAELVQTEARSGSALGDAVRRHIETGMSAPPFLVAQVVRKAISIHARQGNYNILLDDFPAVSSAFACVEMYLCFVQMNLVSVYSLHNRNGAN